MRTDDCQNCAYSAYTRTYCSQPIKSDHNLKALTCKSTSGSTISCCLLHGK